MQSAMALSGMNFKRIYIHRLKMRIKILQRVRNYTLVSNGDSEV